MFDFDVRSAQNQRPQKTRCVGFRYPDEKMTRWYGGASHRTCAAVGRHEHHMVGCSSHRRRQPVHRKNTARQLSSRWDLSQKTAHVVHPQRCWKGTETQKTHRLTVKQKEDDRRATTTSLPRRALTTHTTFGASQSFWTHTRGNPKGGDRVGRFNEPPNTRRRS